MSLYLPLPVPSLTPNGSASLSLWRPDRSAAESVRQHRPCLAVTRSLVAGPSVPIGPGYRPEGLRPGVARRTGAVPARSRVEGHPGNARKFASSDVYLTVSFAVSTKGSRHRRCLARGVDVHRPRTCRERKGENPNGELVLANGNEFPHTGKIGAIEAPFNNETGTIPFRADFPNPDGLAQSLQIELIGALISWWSMIFSENRPPPPDHVRGQAFSGSCSSWRWPPAVYVLAWASVFAFAGPPPRPTADRSRHRRCNHRAEPSALAAESSYPLRYA